MQPLDHAPHNFLPADVSTRLLRLSASDCRSLPDQPTQRKPAASLHESMSQFLVSRKMIVKRSQILSPRPLMGNNGVIFVGIPVAACSGVSWVGDRQGSKRQRYDRR